MSKPPKHPTVASFLTHSIAASGRLQCDIAREIGYDHPNIVTMFKKGHTKLPLIKVGAIAKAIDVDPAELLRLAMTEYMPDTWEAIKDNIGPAFLTEDERRVLETYRGLMIVDDRPRRVPA